MNIALFAYVFTVHVKSTWILEGSLNIYICNHYTDISESLSKAVRTLYGQKFCGCLTVPPT